QTKPAGDLKALEPLLAAKEEGVRAAAARLGGVWKLEVLRASLERQATAPEAPLTVRQAVAEALVALGGPKSAKILVEMTASAFPFKVRSLGVIQLAELDVAAAAKQAGEVLSSAPASADPTELIAALVRQKKGPEALAAVL